jgi:cytochrome c biogenesis protein CcmG/thiol:disulfide interchange protein DsbE
VKILAAHTRVALLVLGATLLLSGCAGTGRSVRQGDVAPALAVTTLVGARSEVRPTAGHALWLTFWATWCYPCRAEWPGLNQAQRDLSGDGLILVAISVQESAGTVQRFLDQQPAAFEVALDPQGQAAARYGVIGFPTHVLIDDVGIVRAVVRGPLDAGRTRKLLAFGDHTGSAPIIDHGIKS